MGARGCEMGILKTLPLMLFLTTAMAACSDDDSGPGPGDGGAADADTDGNAGWRCPLDFRQRWLLEDAVEKLWDDGSDVTDRMSEGSYGFYIRLPGHTASLMQSTTLTSGCPGPQELNVRSRSDNDPNPADPFYVDHDVCHQLVCEDVDLLTIRLYFTMRPHREFADTHIFNYAGNIMYGDNFVWNPNPQVVWRFDERTAGEVTIDADINRLISVEISGEDPVNLSHSGRITAIIIDTNIDALGLNVNFPDIAAGGVQATVTLNANREPEGEVTYDSRVIATFGAMGIEWAENCQWMD